ncbi:acyl carrier protein [Streptomyces sp. CB01881]|uniref:acyl carrier protein n=1 Tax=Streptomyces sp. CB01881 TaxID=2078691 RepID=UPI000CDC86E3|nr:acyl carrier protein [Streptomyces sp. CB01881]AUY53124.1 actinorhodin polyketide synthase [Streptomyces sp. CB01881]TYC69276.1 acyl carrier protein [Streptomyces sp. CB01881]
MNEFSLDRLKQLLQECGEQDESVDIDLSGNIDDVAFDDLGIDSLALFNIFVMIEREYSVGLSYDVGIEAETPSQLVQVVGRAIAAAAHGKP